MRELLKQWMVLEVLFVKREICYAECFLEIVNGKKRVPCIIEEICI